MHVMLPLLRNTDFPDIHRAQLGTVEVNLGYRCNQSGLHCHVNAGPTRTEIRDQRTVRQMLEFVERSAASILEPTGGTPEMTPNFRDIVASATAIGSPGDRSLQPDDTECHCGR